MVVYEQEQKAAAWSCVSLRLTGVTHHCGRSALPWRHVLSTATDRIMPLLRRYRRMRQADSAPDLAVQILARLREQQAAERMGVALLAAVAQVHDAHTQAHAQRMTWLAEATARRLGQPAEEVHLIRLAAQFHDIGKLGIPDGLLHKPGPLTEDEWKVMRRHPVLGQHILMQAGGIFARLSHLVVAHHERWDGQGYPSELAGEAIPLGARILAVVDAYDAMTSARPYRPPLPEAEARAELCRCAGSRYDPQVVQTFLRILDADGSCSMECVCATGREKEHV